MKCFLSKVNHSFPTMKVIKHIYFLPEMKDLTASSPCICVITKKKPFFLDFLMSSTFF